jgi:hypothetical protein
MKDPKIAGRFVGALLIVQMAGFIVPFALLHPITSKDWGVDAAKAAAQIQAATLWLIANTILTVAISSITASYLRLHRALGWGLVLASLAMVVLQAFDDWRIMTMLDFSRHYSGSGASGAALNSVGANLVALRRLVHYPELVMIDVWIACFYAAIWKASLAPKWVALLGWFTVALHFGALVLPMILGGSGVQPLGATMALSHLITATVLIARGFNSPALGGTERE